MSIEKTTSADGTEIAFETTGEGPALILVGGAFCDRTARVSGTPLAAMLAHRFRVFSCDRRGRGDSGDTAPYAVEREVEDLAALIKAAGGSAFMFGNSSGALLALDAAVAQLPIPKLALYDPPVILDAGRVAAFEDIATQLAEAAAAERRAEAVAMYMTKVMQMPEPAFEQIRKSPMMPELESLAHTLSYDLRIATRGPARLAQAPSVRAKTLVMDGSASPPFMRDAIRALASAIPSARQHTLEGQAHAVDPATLAQALDAFFAE